MPLKKNDQTLSSQRKIALYVPFLGFGVNHHTKDQGGFAEAFVKLGYDTYLIVGGVKGDFNPPGYHIIETGNIDKGKTLRGSVNELFFVLSILLRIDYDYIIIWNYNRMSSFIVFLLRISRLFKRNKTKLLLRLDWDGILSGSSLYKFIYKLSLMIYARLFDRIITETPCSFEIVSGLLKNRKDKLSFVPFGVKEGKNLNNLGKTKTILSIARYNRIKGQDVLLKAFSIVHSSEPEWKLKLYGMIQDRSYFEELLDFVEKNNLSGCVELHGEISDNELEHSYSEASIFALLSYSESFAIVRAEASYYGLPVVTTDAGCGSTYGDKTIPYGDFEAASNIILDLIRNPHTRVEIASSQRKNIKTWDEVAQIVLTLT